MKKIIVYVFLFVLLISGESQASIIEYGLTNLGGTQWQYDYTILNNTLSSPIEEFTIYFDYTSYSNLAISASNADWDGLIVEPQTILGYEQDGFIDALSLTGGLALGDTASGFSVAFDWLGTGSPMSQSFDIVNAADFSVMDSGTTQQKASTSVPEPGTALLFGSGLIALAGLRKKITS